MRWYGECLAAALVWAVTTTRPAIAAPASAASATTSERAGAPLDLFDERHPILQIRIVIPPPHYTNLLEAPRGYVPVTLTEAGVTYTNVALRVKGNEGGSFRPVDDKPAMTLNFDKFEEGQLFHEYDKIYLNNSVEDASYMAEFLCGELFRAAGVPAPRITYALVTVNGRRRGLYVVKEGFNKRFLRRALGNADGNFYEGGQVADIDEGLELSSGDGPEGNADLMALAASARDPDPARRWQRLGALLDREAFITFMAMEVLTGHWDGYSINRNNYRVYHDPQRGIVFMPHGMDIMFSEPESPPVPYMDGLVSRALIETQPGLTRYRARLRELREETLDVERMTNRVNQLRSRIRPWLSCVDVGMGPEHDRAVELLLERMTRRARVAKEWMLEGEPRSPVFDATGRAAVTDWRPRDEQGEAALTRTDSLLDIRASSHAQSRPSWRSTVFLVPGRYRFVGRVRTEGVRARAARLGDGAGIRVAGRDTKREGVFGDSDWLPLEYDFMVEFGVEIMEVELICELLATEGQAWFDLGSLGLVRLP